MKEQMCQLIAFHAETMGYIMYLNQALKQDAADEFFKAVLKEVNGHVEKKHWELVKSE